MADKLLAEWFWTDRWMGSSAFLLPLEARGLYREMLTQAWRRGARLPKDPQTIQRACGVTPEEWSRCWPLVKRYWEEDGAHLVNLTQQGIYEESRQACESAAARGKKGAAARWGNARADAQVKPEQCPPSPSPDQTPEPSPKKNLSSAGADAGVAMVVRVWNQNRGPLPEIKTVAKDRLKLVRMLAQDSEGDEILLASTVAAFASDPHNREHRFTIETLCRHRSKWLDHGRNGYTPPSNGHPNLLDDWAPPPGLPGTEHD